MRRDRFRLPIATLRQLLADGEGYASIGRLYGVGENSVRYRCRMLGIRPLVNGRRPSEAALRLALSHPTISLGEIGRAFGCEGNTVRVAARAYGLPTDVRGREALRDAR
jgi:hypothetical protein